MAEADVMDVVREYLEATKDDPPTQGATPEESKNPEEVFVKTAISGGDCTKNYYYASKCLRNVIAMGL